MTSRAFALVVGVPLVIALASCRPAPPPAPTADEDAAAIRQMLIDWYAAYSSPTIDEAHYREFMVEEYALLENGTIMGVEDDLKMMRTRAPGYARKDAFDFRSVRLHGDLAYATYFLESEIGADTKIQHRKWLESAIVRRVGGRWRVALLHSTRTSGSDTPRQAPAAPPKPAQDRP
jgi:ketosteroid isomerase-like protein